VDSMLDDSAGIGARLIADGWPAPGASKNGMSLQIAQGQPGNTRHDILVEKSICGKLIGKGGAMMKELKETSACEIFIFSEDEPPAPVPNDKRLVVCVGQTVCVMAAVGAIMNIVESTPANRIDSMSTGGMATGGFSPQTALFIPPQDPNSPFKCHPSGWPPANYEGGRIRTAQATPGAVRHDVLIHKDDCGRVIGKGAAMYKELTMKTGCKIFVLDKEAPPTEAPDVRLIIMCGSPDQVSMAVTEVTRVLNEAKNRSVEGPGARGSKRGFDSLGMAPMPAMLGGQAYGAPPQGYAPPGYGAVPPAVAPIGGGLHGLENPGVMAAAATAWNSGVTPEALQLYGQLVQLQGGVPQM